MRKYGGYISKYVSLTLCSCRGLKVLVDLLDEDFIEQRDLVVHALNGIGNVFDLQSPTPKNDFCRMFIREGLLNPLSTALINVISTDSETSAEMKGKIIHIIVIFCQVSQSDVHVRNALGTRMVVRRKEYNYIQCLRWNLHILNRLDESMRTTRT